MPDSEKRVLGSVQNFQLGIKVYNNPAMVSSKLYSDDADFVGCGVSQQDLSSIWQDGGKSIG